MVGALLMDLSEAFDCLPHDLLIAKLEAYGFHTKTPNIFKSYLNQRKQFVNINGTLIKILERTSSECTSSEYHKDNSRTNTVQHFYKRSSPTYKKY